MQPDKEKKESEKTLLSQDSSNCRSSTETHLVTAWAQHPALPCSVNWAGLKSWSSPSALSHEQPLRQAGKALSSLRMGLLPAPTHPLCTVWGVGAVPATQVQSFAASGGDRGMREVMAGFPKQIRRARLPLPRSQQRPAGRTGRGSGVPGAPRGSAGMGSPQWDGSLFSWGPSSEVYKRTE